MFHTFLHGNQELAGTKREREREEEEGNGKRWSGREREKEPTGAVHAELKAYLSDSFNTQQAIISATYRTRSCK